MKSKVARRGFLKLMGGAAVSGKHVATAAAEQAGLSLGLAHPQGNMPTEVSVYAGQEARRKSLWQRFINNELPKWKLEEIRREQSRVVSLDPDLASFRSFSLVAKVHHQRERQISRAISDLRHYWGENAERDRFMKENQLDYF
jgi:hypothetical protein